MNYADISPRPKPRSSEWLLPTLAIEDAKLSIMGMPPIGKYGMETITGTSDFRDREFWSCHCATLTKLTCFPWDLKPEKRWTARKCLKYLWKTTQADAGIDGGPGVEGGDGFEGGTTSGEPIEVEGNIDGQRGGGNSKKRPSMTLSEEDLPSEDLGLRSYNHSLSIHRSQNRLPPPDAKTILSDTLPWEALFSASPSPSSASTRHYDNDAGFLAVAEEESTDVSDTELESDWDEDDSKDKGFE
ncbi:hypothetical protein MMC11_000947 [Xylographa trunciseda]|nr:hypothetical protein [Xylographa trunciseda]